MKLRCYECGTKVSDRDTENSMGWFVDMTRFNETRGDMCFDCRLKTRTDIDGDVRCERCMKIVPWGEGKWNINCGAIQCNLCGILCDDCHGILHYNK